MESKKITLCILAIIYLILAILCAFIIFFLAIQPFYISEWIIFVLCIGYFDFGIIGFIFMFQNYKIKNNKLAIKDILQKTPSNMTVNRPYK